MLKIKKKKKKKTYDFEYKIYWKNGNITEGKIKNSKIPPENIFLNNSLTYFSDAKCVYYNPLAIRNLEIFNLIEKVWE